MNTWPSKPTPSRRCGGRPLLRQVQDGSPVKASAPSPRLALPGAEAAHAAPHLDRVRQSRVVGDPPIEPVAAEIHVAPAAFLVGVERVPHLAADVFGMRDGDHAGVGRQRLNAVEVDVVVGDDVVVLTALLQPIEEMRVVAVVEDAAARPHVEDRTPRRADAPTAAVAVGVVSRQPEFAVFLQIEIVHREREQALEHGLGVHLIEPQRAVGVGEERRRARDHR